MGFLDRQINRQAETHITRSAVCGYRGSITAHQAWSVAAPVARRLDPRARMTLITSGLDMDHYGRSRTWEFIFYIPGQNATMMLSLEPDPDSPDIDTAPSVLTQRLRQAFPDDALRPPFPWQFRDSPEVVAEFTAKGIDFVAGPTDMKLEGRMLPSGDAVWVTYSWDLEYTAPFTAAGS
jgi:hypothetical protein